MKEILKSKFLAVGLAIFSMFFGAGDLVFAVFVGKSYQSQTPLALTGFVLTAAFLPILGILSILAYDGDYRAYFGRLGRFLGPALAFVTMAVIAPVVSMPRIVSLSYQVAEPWMPFLTPALFAFFFLGVIFLLTATESRIIDILGYVISPLLLGSLLLIFVIALIHPGQPSKSDVPFISVLTKNLVYGYHTLNFLTSIFFGAVVVSILKKAGGDQRQSDITRLGLMGSLIGVSLLGLIYVGLGLTGAAHSEGMGNLSEGNVFAQLMFRMLGNNGGVLLTVTVLMACVSTIMALAAVAAEFLKNSIFRERMSYRSALVLSLVVTGFVSVYGLSNIIHFSEPVISVLHPVVIVLAVLNLAHKWFGFDWIKGPVALTFLVSLWLHVDQIRMLLKI